MGGGRGVGEIWGGGGGGGDMGFAQISYVLHRKCHQTL